MFRPLLIASLATVAIVGGVALLAAPSAEVRANTPRRKTIDPKLNSLRANALSMRGLTIQAIAFVTTAARPAKLPMYALSLRANCRTQP